MRAKKQYGLIERQKALSAGMDYEIVAESFREMSRRNADIPGLSRKIIQYVDGILSEKRKALEQLSRLILRIVVPVPIRLAMWETQHDPDVFVDQKNAGRAMGYEIRGRKKRKTAGYMETVYRDPKTCDDMRHRIAAISETIRCSAKQMVECQHQLNIEIFKMWLCMKETLIPNLMGNRVATRDMKSFPKFETWPEFSDEATFGITEKDFAIDPEQEATANSSEGKTTTGRGNGSEGDESGDKIRLSEQK